VPDPAAFAQPAGDGPRAAVEWLAGDARVHLIGVRHHSPVLAVAVAALLDTFAPDAVLVELPEQMQPWLDWLAHPETVAPVALAAASASGGPLAFYPFADFSPELAALRWARRNGVPAVCCDLPLTDPAWRDRAAPVPGGPPAPTLGEAVHATLTGRAGDDLWDRWVEAAAPGSSPEAVRRAALAAGWALRHDTPAVGELDLRREAWMRSRIAATSGRLAVVVGAFHAPALLSGPVPDDAADTPGDQPVISLVPYLFDLLDARSGYPAGIRDPRWQQAVHDCAADPQRIGALTEAFAVEVTRELRAQGHPAGPAEAGEVARLAGDLARLRTLPAPGRGELVESLQSVLAQGEPTGRGRAVAAAMQAVLVGQRRGRLADGTPVTGLRPAIGELMARLRLPGPGDKAQRVRLDPLRSPLDRERELTLRRLTACSVPYASADTPAATGLEMLTTSWRLEWTPGTDAALAVAGLHGITLAQAAAGMLATGRRHEAEAGGPTAEQALTGLAVAAGCGLPELVTLRLADVRRSVCGTGTLADVVAALDLLQRLERGHFPGLAEAPATGEIHEELHAAAVAAVAGLAGSSSLDDARALYGLAQLVAEAGRLLRIRHEVQALAARGSPVMRGAAAAVGVLLGIEEPGALGVRLASWVDLPDDAATDRLRGALSVAGAALQAGGDVLTPMLDAVDEMTDDGFVRRLPALRAGFDALSPADRDRLLRTVTDRLGDVEQSLPADPGTLAAWLAADQAGLVAVRALGLPVPDASTDADADADADAGAGAGAPDRPVLAAGIPAAQRWRLLLGREPEELPEDRRRLAVALDELYGAGHGEGAYTVDGGAGAGREPPYPQVRDWLEDLEELFGARVRDEVLARAAEHGRLDALLAVDPDRVRPSVDLLHAVLSLAGGLPETRLAKLRPLVARLVAQLTAQLARRIRPALTGLGTPRPTRRPTGRLDLAATVRRNLHTARTGPDGRAQLAPERMVFRSHGRRSVDWQVVLLVDVSGSMEQSTVWAALTAAVLAGVPALRTHFVTFSTEVVDMTDRVDDPLALLLEISVGGGTHIAAGLRYARQIVTTPSRTLVVLVSDFEEGYPIGGLLSAVRALVDDGVTLLGCASLDDQGAPRYSTAIAGQLVAAGMPVAALSPVELAGWIGERVT
jgi:hypothetical protein